MKGSMLHGGCYLVKGQYTVVMCNTMICKYGVLFNTLPAKHLIHIVLSQLPNDTREKLTLHFCGVLSFIYFLFDPFGSGKLTTNTGVRWIDKAFLDLPSWMFRAIFLYLFLPCILEHSSFGSNIMQPRFSKCLLYILVKRRKKLPHQKCIIQ